MDFEEKRQHKIDRYKELSKKASERSKTYEEQAHNISSFIPPGQPILIGHHSESNHRRDLKRIHNYTRKSIEEADKADYYSSRAKSAESNNSIFSDDPEAITKLKERIEELESNQEYMKKINAAFRKCKGDWDKLDIADNIKEELIKAQKRDWRDQGKFIPFESYALSNNRQNITRLKNRLKELESRIDEVSTEKQFGDIKIIDNIEDNRVQIFFPDKPNGEIRKKLKANGFRWSRNNGAWQRHRSSWALYLAEELIKEILSKGNN